MSFWATGLWAAGFWSNGFWSDSAPVIEDDEVQDVSNLLGRALRNAISKKGGTMEGNLTFEGGGWDEAHLVLGNNHLWVDSTGDLRINVGAPASDTDGTVVGGQT